MKKMLFLFCLAAILTLIFFQPHSRDTYVHIFFCDVGQGDGIFILHNSFQMVIDGGPDDKITSCVQRFMPMGDHTLEVVVATHADSDHSTGLINLLKEYQVKTLYTQAYGKKTATWEKFRVEVKKAYFQGMKIHQPTVGERIIFDPILSALILWPLQKKGPLTMFTEPLSETQLSAIYDKEEKEFNTQNNEAIALFLIVNNIKIAFTSDLESPIELALQAHGLLEDIDVLKAGHHGSKTSNTVPFLHSLRPEAVVVSVGRNNRYGHPNPGVIANFEGMGMKVFRTDKQGTIEMITDGITYWWKTYSSK